MSFVDIDPKKIEITTALVVQDLICKRRNQMKLEREDAFSDDYQRCAHARICDKKS